MSGQRDPGPGTWTGGVVPVADGSGSTGMPPVVPWLRAVASETAVRARRTVFRLVVLVLVLVLVLWVSVFLYGSFYFSFLPAASFSVPVHLVYPVPDPSRSGRSFPAANVSLMRAERDPVLVPGQPYRVSLDLELPESPVNRRLGMFVVQMSVLDQDGSEVAASARSAMLHYRSGLLRSAGTLVLLPVLLAGITEQKQLLEVELFTDYRHDARRPPRSASVQLRDHRVQVYSARLRVHASFTGLRYVLYNFPVTAAVVGVASNFLFLSLAVLLSYLQLTWGGLWPPDPVPVRVLMGDNSRIQRRTEEARRRREKNRKEEVQEEEVRKEVQEEEVHEKEVQEEEVHEKEVQEEEVHEKEVQEEEVQEKEVQEEEVSGPRVQRPVREAAEPSEEILGPSRTPETLRSREEVQNSEEQLKGPKDPQPGEAWTLDPGPVLRQRTGP